MCLVKVRFMIRDIKSDNMRQERPSSCLSLFLSKLFPSAPQMKPLPFHLNTYSNGLNCFIYCTSAAKLTSILMFINMFELVLSSSSPQASAGSGNPALPFSPVGVVLTILTLFLVAIPSVISSLSISLSFFCFMMKRDDRERHLFSSAVRFIVTPVNYAETETYGVSSLNLSSALIKELKILILSLNNLKRLRSVQKLYE
ncbi:hypothetical protein DNTS_008844, partial [Danionella cerebrum]